MCVWLNSVRKICTQLCRGNMNSIVQGQYVLNCAGAICMSIVQGQYVLYVNCVCQLYRDNMYCMSIVYVNCTGTICTVCQLYRDNMYVNCAGTIWYPEYDASACVVCDCKLDQFVNGPPVYELGHPLFKLVGPLSIIQREVVPFRD